jgi:hypothetical protein
MDFSQLFSQLPWWFWAVLTFLFLLSLARPIFDSPAFKGKFGEAAVNDMLKKSLDEHQYHLLENVTLYALDGTTQIDHILVSQYGIFVIETKNMAGWIFGDAKQAKWTQVLYKKKTQFQNPLRQNYKHLKALETLTGLPDSKFIPVVVFVGESEFKTPMPSNVVRGRDLITFIQSKKIPLVSETEAQDILQKIEIGRLEPGKETDRAHKEYVKEFKFENKTNTAPNPKKTTLSRLIGFALIVGLGFGIFQFLQKPAQKEVITPTPGKQKINSYSNIQQPGAPDRNTQNKNNPATNQIISTNPETLEYELAQQACNTAIATALTDQSELVLKRRDELCKKYRDMKSPTQ